MIDITMDKRQHNVSVTVEKVKNGFFVNFPTWKEIAKDEHDLSAKIAASIVEGITNFTQIYKSLNTFKVDITLTL